ncbi:hypothetical protein [Rugamonas sp.]|uniref:hypothetical protein n=1 Tax=Rugamonas sp. TaxID=1926287 RepID=UPI0025DB61D1|nr:hypothetical protein [Rugamonas sp.]
MPKHWSLIALLLSLSGPAGATETPAAAPPQTYALVAAMGGQFNIVSEVPNVGSHAEPYRRTHLAVAGDLLNRLVLQDLDQTVAGIDPASKRVFLSMPAPNLEHVGLDQREQGGIDAVVVQLKTMAQERRGWHHILVVTPAYRALDKNDMATRLEGMGVFVEPLCQANPANCNQGFFSREGGNIGAVRTYVADGDNTFAAPYSYLAVWELDPVTLQVLSHMRVFKEDKVGIPQFDPMAMDIHLIAARMEKLIRTSIREGLHRNGVSGHVEVIELKEPSASDAAH